MADEKFGPGLYWLSFVDPDQIIKEGPREQGGPGFLGVCIVEANSPIDALRETWRMKINPGGEVAIGGPFPPEAVAPEMRNRLLTAEEAKEI